MSDTDDEVVMVKVNCNCNWIPDPLTAQYNYFLETIEDDNEEELTKFIDLDVTFNFNYRCPKDSDTINILSELTHGADASPKVLKRMIELNFLTAAQMLDMLDVYFDKLCTYDKHDDIMMMSKNDPNIGANRRACVDMLLDMYSDRINQYSVNSSHTYLDILLDSDNVTNEMIVKYATKLITLNCGYTYITRDKLRELRLIV
jgi:hypothetical protein